MEVFPKEKDTNYIYVDFLHVCGGVSDISSNISTRLKFSPRMWRCFYNDVVYHDDDHIFSTYVEVFLNMIFIIIAILYFLHVCGGVSI